MILEHTVWEIFETGCLFLTAGVVILVLTWAFLFGAFLFGKAGL